MTRRPLLFLLLTGGALAQPCLKSGSCVLHIDMRAGPHQERVIRIPPDQFQPETLRQHGHSFHGERGNALRTAVLWIVTSRRDAELVLGVRVTDILYHQWRREWLRQSRRMYPVARVSFIGQDARLDYRTASGNIGRVVLSGKDPFLIGAGAAGLEIAHLQAGFVRSVPDDGRPPSLTYSVDLLCPRRRYIPLSEAIMRELSARLGTAAISAMVRNNSWFIGSSIPILFPFQPPTTPPPTLAHADEFVSWCFLRGGQYECQ